MRRLAWVVVLAAACLGMVGSPAAGAAREDYQGAVQHALGILHDGGSDPQAVAQRALAALGDGAAGSQPEIEADLRARPPRIGDATARLQALSDALQNPAFTSSPRHADQALRQILAQPRYAGLRPSPLDQLRQAVVRALLDLLARLLSHANGAPGWVFWIFVGFVVLVLGGVAFFLFRALWRVPRREVAAGALSPELARRAEERFAEADRLAAAGDLAGAVRRLASAVAAALGEDRDWETSPLTVRELFGRSPNPPALGPLLSAFELSVYGGHPPDEDAYRRAAAAAAPYRGVAAGERREAA